MKELFIRPHNEKFNSEYLNRLQEQLTIHNLNKWNARKIIKLYDKRYDKEFLYYRFCILNSWIKENEKFDSNYLRALEKNIKTLRLKNFINHHELNYLIFIRSYIFTSHRNIKSLIVDFPLESNEKIYFHYSNIDMQYTINNKLQKINNVFDMYFGDKRFIFTGYLDIISINISDIKSICFNIKSITFVVNNIEYIITGNDLKIIELSIRRLFKILKLKELWQTN